VIASIRISPYQVPLRLRGEVIGRRGWWLTVTDRQGRVGLGDAAPWYGFGASEERVAAALHRAAVALHGVPVQQVPAVAADLNVPAEVGHAIDLATLDLLAQEHGVPVWRLLSPEAAPDGVRVHTLVDDPAEAAAAAERGACLLKLKVGADPDRALAAIHAALAAAPGCRLRVDVNGAMAVDAARALLVGLPSERIDWVEQPVADLADFAALRGLGVQLAADESLCREPLQDVLPLADAVVIKPMFVGGPRRALLIARRALAAGKRVCVTNALESRVGRLGALHLAAAIGRGAHGVAERGVVGPLAVPCAAGLGLAARGRAA